MRRREQLCAKIVVTTMLAAVLVSALLLYLMPAADAGSAGLRDRLQCDTDRVVATTVAHDNNTKETREPDELAAQWADHMASQRPSLVKQHNISHKSGNRRQLAFSDSKGQIIAVLSYERDARLGWRLESIIECA
jgi:hypothetical protein